MKSFRLVVCAVLLALFAATSFAQTAPTATTAKPTAKPKAVKKGTPAEAEKFVKAAEKDLLDLSIKAARISWIQATYITDDTEALAAEANEALTKRVTELAEESTRYDGLKISADIQRKLKLLKLALSVPAPKNAAERSELTKINVSMESDYGKGKYCPDSGKHAQRTPAGEPKCLSLGDMEKVLAESRDPEALKEMWVGWHKVSPPLKQRYSRFVELANKGAREQGFKDVGALWRSNYDMPPDAFATEMERLWQQVKPLYLSLHTYTRNQLRKKYGPNVVSDDGPIPAHLLGNMWSQEWGNIYDVVKPAEGGAGVDLTAILTQRKTDAKQMVRYGEGFFTSLGMEKLPDTFWTRSLFLKPQDRDVVCHASAWDIDSQKDVRIKMCIKINAEDFNTIHHELGHNYYQMAYAHQSFIYQNSANDGFHEALGDTVALSVTPEYLKKLGFIETVPPADADTALLLQEAMDKVAFLPFGYLMDQWRWKVFSGETKPADYNKSWWELRTRYQGIAPPVARSEADFDPGAKYHIPANVPYARYFLARILQFQFHRSLCKEAGYTGPLHRCSVYGNQAAGARLKKMMAMGASRPWPEALKALTGEEKMDATAMIDYFAPLKKWLDQQNKGQKSGW
ncbi:MAG: M2 family metallopeptidase [Terriglobales bacterium]